MLLGLDLGIIKLMSLALILAACFDQFLVGWWRHRGDPARPRNPRSWLGKFRDFLTPLPSELGARAQKAEAAEGLHPIPSILRYVRLEVLRDRRRRTRLTLALAGMVVSTGIGLRYSTEVMVEGWQLWAWAAALALTCLSLMPSRLPSAPRRVPWVWLVVLLAAGMTLRATLLEVVPGELHPDEGGLAIFTQLHVYPRAGLTVNPFVTGSVVQPTLHSYVLYLGMAIAGKSIAALRLSSALVGSLAILACYAAVATIDGRRTGLLAAAIMTTYHYHIHWSRLALNNVWDTLWVPLVLAAFAWGWKRKWSGGAVLAGLALGLSQYFYAGNKVVVILLPVLAAQLWREDPDRRRMGIHLSKLLATAFCAAIPLALFALSNPEIYFARIPQIIGWHPAAVLEATGSSSDWAGYFWHQARRALGAYVAYTDITGFYGPGIAFTFGASACAFGLGTLWAIRSRRWVPLAWALLTAILGGFMLLTPPSSSHYVVSIPAVAWLIALPLDALIARGWGNVAAVSLGAIMASDLLFYFGVYVPQGAPHLSVPFPLLPSP